MTMILMYVSSQTVPESAFEDDYTKNKMLPRVRNLENKILQNIFFSQMIYVELVYNAIERRY